MKPILNFINLILLTVTVPFISCKKEIGTNKLEQEIATENNNGNSGNVDKVYVSDVSQLYEAVNNPENAGNQIVLSAGVYILNSNNTSGGRLELQTNMSLIGEPGHPESVVIDESELPAASFATGTVRTGGIRMGSGANNIEWLTVKGGAITVNPFSVIDTDLPSIETHIGIFHVNIIGNGSSVGIDIRNRRPEQAGRKIYAVLEHNDITGVITFLGPGIEIQNANNASGSFINVNLSENYIHGNKVGVGAFNNGASSSVIYSSIEVISHADRIEGNGIGMDLGGGLSQVATALGNGNHTTIEMHGSSIKNNNPASMPPELQPVLPGLISCGIYFFGGDSFTGGKASDNTLNASFWGCDISENNGTDIYAFGAHSNSGSPAGTNNVLEIYLHGVSNQATVVATPSSPIEPTGTNVANIFR